MVHYGFSNNTKSSPEKPKKGVRIEEDDTSISYGRFCLSKFVEFCQRTDLHGYKYIVMKELSVFERTVWAVSVLVSMAFATYFVVIAYNWYARNPIVTVIESTQGAIWDIPFPAITICNLNIVSRRAARAFADNLTRPANVTADDIFEMTRLVPLLNTVHMASPAQKQALARLQAVLDLNHISIETLVTQLSPAWPCARLVERCMWKNTIYRCDALFKPIFTHLSQCCTFNYYGLDNTEKTKEEPATPMRVASCGYQTALTVLLNTDSGDYYSGPIASQGALVFIDGVYNFPDVDSPMRMVNPSTELLVALSPERTYATAGVRAFSTDVRHCYYNDEVKIGNFRQYSFHNCMAFRRVEIIKNACECIPYYFPQQDYHRTCNFNDLDCLQSISGHGSGYLESEKELRCLPECEHYDYQIEVALGKLAQSIRLGGLPFFNDVNLENRSLINVFFNDLVSTRYRRDVYLNWQNLLGFNDVNLENRSLINVFFNDLVSTRYRRDVYLNWQNLLASFGGLLGLMLGFTLIAGFDLLLFCTFGLANGSGANRGQEDQRNDRLHKKAMRSNKVFVRETKRIDNNFNKMILDKDLSKLHIEKRFVRTKY